MSSLQKKVVLRQFTGNLLPGYLPVSGFVQGKEISYLNLQGRVSTVPLLDIKTVCYVRDFNLSDPLNPERLLRRTFLARPRGDGLWIRLTFRGDADVLEGLTSADISLADALIADQGLYLSPPDTRTNTQRVFVPRSAMADFQILAVIHSPSSRVKTKSSSDLPIMDREIQKSLFEEAQEVPAKRAKREDS